jgi:hypothetical protein
MPGLSPCKREQLRRLVAGVAFAVLVAALRCGDGLGDVVGNVGGLQRRRDEHQAGKQGDEAAHGFSPGQPGLAMLGLYASERLPAGFTR